MGRWTDIAPWGGPPADNFGDGDQIAGEAADRMLDHRGVVVHIAEGTGPGTESWERNPASDISSHFIVDVDGHTVQMLDTDDYSWCQAGGNRAWISVENAGWSGRPLTGAQVEANAQILAAAHRAYGVPLEATSDPDGRGLGHHAMGGDAWGGHWDCPGGPIVAQKAAIVARAQEIVTGAAGDEEDDAMPMLMLIRYKPAPEVFLSDGVTARWVTTEAEIADLRTLAAEGSLRLGYGGQVRVVGRRELVGRIVGRVPVGWSDLAAVLAPAGPAVPAP